MDNVTVSPHTTAIVSGNSGISIGVTSTSTDSRSAERQVMVSFSESTVYTKSTN